MIGKIILLSIISQKTLTASLNHNQIKTLFQAPYVDHFDTKTNGWDQSIFKMTIKNKSEINEHLATISVLPKTSAKLTVSITESISQNYERDLLNDKEALIFNQQFLVEIFYRLINRRRSEMSLFLADDIVNKTEIFLRETSIDGYLSYVDEKLVYKLQNKNCVNAIMIFQFDNQGDHPLLLMEIQKSYHNRVLIQQFQYNIFERNDFRFDKFYTTGNIMNLGSIRSALRDYLPDSFEFNCHDASFQKPFDQYILQQACQLKTFQRKFNFYIQFYDHSQKLGHFRVIIEDAEPNQDLERQNQEEKKNDLSLKYPRYVHHFDFYEMSKVDFKNLLESENLEKHLDLIYYQVEQIYRKEIQKRLGDQYSNRINKLDFDKLLIFDKKLQKTIKTKNTKNLQILEFEIVQLYSMIKIKLTNLINKQVMFKQMHHSLYDALRIKEYISSILYLQKNI